MSTTSIKLSEIIPPHFFEAYKDIKSHNHTEYIFPGGRGSCKSSFVGELIPLILKRNPEMHCLVLRKVSNTLKDSVFNQIIWAIGMLGLSKEFKTTLSPLQIVYKPTGQTIYFRGLDDPLKVKSIKPPFGYIGILWLDELDQFNGEEQIRSVEQSVKRGGDKYYVFKSFNPPISINNWANKYVLESKKDRIVYKSDYRTVPHEWLGETFFNGLCASAGFASAPPDGSLLGKVEHDGVACALPLARRACAYRGATAEPGGRLQEDAVSNA